MLHLMNLTLYKCVYFIIYCVNFRRLHLISAFGQWLRVILNTQVSFITILL